MKRQIKQSRGFVGSATCKSQSQSWEPVRVGVVGLGLMGTSITTCLLAAGYPVVAIDTDISRRQTVRHHLHALLREMRRAKLPEEPVLLAANLSVAEDFGALRDSGLIVGCFFEDLEAKRNVLPKLEDAVGPDVLIGSNTSALLVTELQCGARHPQRILDIHWAGPARPTLHDLWR